MSLSKGKRAWYIVEDWKRDILVTNMKNTSIAYISVGSNLGKKLENCRHGIIALTNCGDTALMSRSPFYRTEPVDYTDQDWFTNACFSVTTSLSPEELLNRIRVVQRSAGRKKSTVRFGPRPLDLDILFYDDRIISTPQLIIPHPRMHKRRFVLKPLCDINPNLVHPVLRRTMEELLSRLDCVAGSETQQVVLIDD